MDEDEYLLPRSVELTYSIPPPARPYSPNPQSLMSQSITGYLEMQPKPTTSTGRITPNGRRTPGMKLVDQSNDTSSKSSTPVPSTELPDCSRSATESSSENCEDKVQGELLEIINDFKNNVFTLTEVEQLVDNWRNRNDVQKSFREKEEQLNSMRKEYDRIQQLMKEEMKRATPFDRIKKLFSRSPRNKGSQDRGPATKDIHFDVSDDKNTNEGTTSGVQNHLRPISSLSLQSTASSSSSGRMSTLSGCSSASLGDSGTHSDHEERKHLMRQASSDHEYFEINDPKKTQGFNYLVPPTPKPLFKYNQVKQHIPVQQFSTINERPPQPEPRVELPVAGDAYYIQFPPSGLPVGAPLTTETKPKSRTPSPMALPADSHVSSEYMNFPVGGTVVHSTLNESLPEYMNFQPPSSPSPALPPRNS